MSEVSAAPLFPEPARVVTGQVAPRATLGGLLEDFASPETVARLVDAARPLHDLARLSAGRPFGLALGPDGLLAAFTYGIDELRTLRIRRFGEELRADILTRAYEREVAVVSATIRSSLFATLEELGEQDQLALDLAEIFAWDVDFNTEIQNGDAFRVAVERLSLGGRFRRYGPILAAELRRGERVLRAVRFETGRGADYYTPEGFPLRKAFLRSPLRFTRISSGFSHSRLHPILGRVATHYGVDFAAPEGTPVGAAADGIVTLAGWQGGFGRSVRLRHANGYETLYGHLSRVRVAPGQRVSQGEAIGAVGSTGLATGPHLDYRMLRNGSPVNPLTVALPPAEPLGAVERAAFAPIVAARLALLDRAQADPAGAGRRASSAR